MQNRLAFSYPHWNTHKLKMCVLILFVNYLLTPAFAADSIPHIKNKVSTDLRVIVDISGSMKKTDPNNLRRPAIRLLAGLIPEGARAGIWNFGKQVNMAVKIGEVNESWRDLAREQSKKISSVGLYTNIESAMRKASFDWKEPDPNYKRNLILLTDGHVDIGQDEKLDKASRKRIIKNILPALEKAKVRVHTIALSDDVDESLLSTLSAYTGGLYKKVSSADELQKLFLQMLEQSVPLDTLPLKDNRFNVDANINDMTLLVFNKDKSQPTKVVTPAKKTWDKNTKSENINWYSDEGYDLITVKNPQHGQWKIFAPIDPANRVVVATNLKLKLNELPGYLMLGDSLKVTASLQEDGKALSDQRLLSKFKFEVNKKAEKSAIRNYPMLASASDNIHYTAVLAPIFEPGNIELVVQAKSPTAQRESRHQVKVYAAPAEIKIKENNGKYQVEVKPYSNLIRPGSVKLTAVLKDKSKHELKQVGDSWLLDVDSEFHQSMFDLNIEAVRADGKPLSMSFSKVLAEEGQQKLQAVKKEENKAEVKQAAKETQQPGLQQQDKSAVEKEEPEVNKQGVNWTFIIISVVIGNLFLIASAIGGYLYLKRRKQKMAAELAGEMSNGDSDDKDAKDKEENNS